MARDVAVFGAFLNVFTRVGDVEDFENALRIIREHGFALSEPRALRQCALRIPRGTAPESVPRRLRTV